MSKLTDAFKAFTQALLGTEEAIPGGRLSDVVEYAAESYTLPTGNGEPGADGLTPEIGVNGNWFIGETDTGVKAAGADGAAGLSVTAIELEVDGDGKVVGGTATLSDDSEIPLTVTEAAGGN